jgi:hypothetical protein
VIGKLAPGGDSAGFSSFVVGIGGLSISGLIIDMFRARRADMATTRRSHSGTTREGRRCAAVIFRLCYAARAGFGTWPSPSAWCRS